MPELALNQIGQIAVNVADLEAAVSFYRDILGMKFLFQIPGLAFFDCNGVRLLLDEQAGWQYPSSILYYKVDDIQEAYQILGQQDIIFKQKPHMVAKMPDHELWIMFFEDPSGNLLALMSEIPYET
jgi:methylmalonyl-CoA/ethylmalonyl-CoA epimerase